MNLAYPFFDKAKDIKNTDNENYKTFFFVLWIFDVFLLNIDRTIHNTNKAKTLKPILIDWILTSDWVSATKNLAQILEQDFSKAIHNNEVYYEMMDKLTLIPVETEEERKKRALDTRKNLTPVSNTPLSKNT